MFSLREQPDGWLAFLTDEPSINIHGRTALEALGQLCIAVGLVNSLETWCRSRPLIPPEGVVIESAQIEPSPAPRVQADIDLSKPGETWDMRY